MDRERQIEEMRYLADEMGKAISTEYEKRVLADERKLEAVLKENGWRKASDVAREIFEEIEKTLKECLWFLENHPSNYPSMDRTKINVYKDNLQYIAELKKKYTEEK